MKQQILGYIRVGTFSSQLELDPWAGSRMFPGVSMPPLINTAL